MRLIRALAFAPLWLVLSCSQPEASGTNTNWLRACDDSTECGGLLCSCGRCTPSCDSDADCATVGGICSSAESALAECRGKPTSRLCLPGCNSSEQCGTDRICYRGACTHTLASMNCSTQTDALMCEDFEGTLEAYRPIVTSGNQVQAVDVATPSGVRALETQVLVAPSTAYLRFDIAALSSGTISLRSWVQVPAGQTAYDLAPIGFWSDQETDWALRVVAKDGQLEAWSYTTPLRGSTLLTLGEWHCLQATLEIADSGRFVVKLDGNTVIDQADFDTLPNGGIGAITLGSLWAGAAAHLLVDRILVRPTAVDCWE